MAFVGWAEGGGEGEGWEVGEGSSRGGGFGDRGGILASLEFQETPWVPTLDFSILPSQYNPMYTLPSEGPSTSGLNQTNIDVGCSGRRVQ